MNCISKAIAFMMLLPSLSFAANITACGVLGAAGTTYVLQNDVTSNGSCFFITASDVVLDLNGHTVTYDNAAPPVPANSGFETALAGSWDVTGAANTTRASGTYVQPVSVVEGTYALKTTTPTADQAVVSAGTVTLAANTRYTLSAMVYNQTSDSISMSVEFDATKKATQTGKTTRGFQVLAYEYTTGVNPESYNITLRVTGAGAAPVGAVYFDDVRVTRSRVIGVMVGPVNWRNPPVCSDATTYGTALRATVKNGTITQGQGAGYKSHAIAVEANSVTGHTFNNLTITNTGIDSQAMTANAFNGGTFYGSTINSSMRAITSRDNMTGTAVYLPGYGSTIHNLNITNGVQVGVWADTTAGQTAQKVYDNNITLQTRYTNDFAITGSGSEVYGNTINCGEGSNSCRGVFIAGNGSKVYNNTVAVQQLLRNQEYNGCQGGTSIGSAYGVQMQKAQNSDVYGNMVTANAGVCEAYALRLNPEEGTGSAATNNQFHGNTFTTIATGSARAASIKTSGSTAGEFTLSGNTFVTNRRWWFVTYDGATHDLTLDGNTWRTAGTLDNPFHPWEVNVYNASYASNLLFTNNIYGSAEDKTRFESDFFRLTASWPNVEPNSSFTVAGGSVARTAPPRKSAVRRW